VPDTVQADQLDREARAQLGSLPNDLADTVARYLVAAGEAEDPEQAYQFAKTAHRLAARVGIVREASGIAAYRTGRWSEALSELRAARRLTGGDDYLPVMADAERALGRLDRALAIIREADSAKVDRATQIELRIVESGIRRDQGLADAAVIALQVPELKSARLRPWSARLFYAYADALLAAGREAEARDAFARAAAADPAGETDAADRLDELDGIEFEDLDELDDELDDEEPHAEGSDEPDSPDHAPRQRDVAAPAAGEPDVQPHGVQDPAVQDPGVEDSAVQDQSAEQPEVHDAAGQPGEDDNVDQPGQPL
jgi:tetratricopeptide (TPR) repeat protein